MNSQNTSQQSFDDDILPEYDFTHGVKGNHYQKYQQRHNVTINYEDGKKITRMIKPEDNIIILDPDVKKYFPDSESVNSTLRSLIKLIPQK
jgi:hypothetical protein